MKTPEGKSLSLYDVKAKVKIVDFWASWCGPCRAENPNVKRIYEQYHSKGLEIVSVSLDVKQDAWVGAIKKDQLPWIHISDLKGWNSLATDVYEIHAIPRLFVLDAENKIIAEGLRGEKLEECVREALNK
jgi:thiol-disulfide isomerase/thioredoxin